MPALTPADVSGGAPSMEGGKRHGVTVKKLKKALKKAGLKTTGKKAALTRRAKKAHLKMKGGEGENGKEEETVEGGRRRKGSRKSRSLFKLY